MVKWSFSSSSSRYHFIILTANIARTILLCGRNCECDAFIPLSVRRDQCALKTFLRMQQNDHILHHFFPQFLPRTNHISLPIMNTHRRATSFTPYCSFLYNRQFSPSYVNPWSVSLAFFHFFFQSVHVNLYLVLIDFHSLDNKRSLLTYLS